jgi:small-conductance mechanosensitive channel
MSKRSSLWSQLRHQISDLAASLDEISFDVGKTHVSLLNALWMVLVVVTVLVLAGIVSRLGRRLVRGTKRFDGTQRALGEKLVTTAVWTFAILIGIDALGISLTALTVFSGAFGLAIGFGLQKTFGNLIAGVILLLDRSIKPGDVIAVTDSKGSTFGEVRTIGVRAAVVTTADNREYLIPNEILMTTQVENWTYSSREVAVSIPVPIAYGSDIVLAERLLLEAARGVPRVLAEPAPSVLLTAFGDTAIRMQLSVWINDPEGGVGNVRSAVLMAAWGLFRTEGVEIAQPDADASVRVAEGLQRIAKALAAGGADGGTGSA